MITNNPLYEEYKEYLRAGLGGLLKGANKRGYVVTVKVVLNMAVKAQIIITNQSPSVLVYSSTSWLANADPLFANSFVDPNIISAPKERKARAKTPRQPSRY